MQWSRNHSFIQTITQSFNLWFHHSFIQFISRSFIPSCTRSLRFSLNDSFNQSFIHCLLSHILTASARPASCSYYLCMPTQAYIRWRALLIQKIRFKRRGLKGWKGCVRWEQQRMLQLGYLIMFCLHSAYFRPRTLPESKVGNRIPLTKWHHEPHSVSANLNYQL